MRKVYALTRPYGKLKVVGVLLLILAQAFFQVLGVTSIFPFLALAANPDSFRNSAIGSVLLENIPPIENETLLVISGIFALVILLLANLVNIIGEYVRNKYSASYGHWLRMRLLNQFASQPYSFFLERNSGILIKKILGDTTAFVSNIFNPILEGITRFITALFLVATLFMVQPKIALISGGIFGTYYIGVFFSLRRIGSETSNQIKKANRGLYVSAQQFFGGIKPILVHQKQNYFTYQFEKHSAAQAILSPRMPIYTHTPRYFIEPILFGSLLIVVIILAGDRESLLEILPKIGVMGFIAYRLLPAIQILYGQITQININRHAFEEIAEELLNFQKDSNDTFQFENKSTETNNNQLRFNREISLRDLSFSYNPEDRNILDTISLTIKKNSSVAIIGSTGSGKSTLVDLLLGLHRPTSGNIFVDEHPLTPENMPQWRNLVGYVPQDIFLLDDTIAKNIALGIPAKEIDYDQITKVASIAQISSFIEKDLSKGLQTIVGERGVRLSGGQRQRIGLARALYHNPEILILDEATSALDTQTEKALVEAIRSLQGRITMVVVAHRLSTIKECDQVFRINQGKIEMAEVEFLE